MALNLSVSRCVCLRREPKNTAAFSAPLQQSSFEVSLGLSKICVHSWAPIYSISTKIASGSLCLLWRHTSDENNQQRWQGCCKSIVYPCGIFTKVCLFLWVYLWVYINLGSLALCCSIGTSFKNNFVYVRSAPSSATRAVRSLVSFVAGSS